MREDESDLAAQINSCWNPLPFICCGCGTQAIGHTRCKKRWCPICQPWLASARNRKLKFAVEQMRWPLFITLTMKNVDDMTPAAIRTLRRSFGKLRHRKLWKGKVKGGIACMEVTNIGNGWHPHLHAVVDCRWLSAGPKEPPQFWTRKDKAARFQEATASVEKVWAKILKQPSASIKIKRCDRTGILKEVIKYSIKGSDLCECKGKVGSLIRAIEHTRLMTSFGTCFGIGKKLAMAAAIEESGPTGIIANKQGISNNTIEAGASLSEGDDVEFEQYKTEILEESDWDKCTCSGKSEWIPQSVWDSANKREDVKTWRSK